LENIFKYAWIVLIGFTVFNAFALKKKVNQYIEENPDLERGYRNFILWNTILTSIPFLIIGFGIVTGQLKDIFEVFDFNSDKWVVKSFFTYIASLWLFGFCWIHFFNGGKFIEKHRGIYQISFLNKKIHPTEKQVKIYYSLTIFSIPILYFVLTNLKFEDLY